MLPQLPTHVAAATCKLSQLRTCQSISILVGDDDNPVLLYGNSVSNGGHVCRRAEEDDEDSEEDEERERHTGAVSEVESEHDGQRYSTHH